MWLIFPRTSHMSTLPPSIRWKSCFTHPLPKLGTFIHKFLWRQRKYYDVCRMRPCFLGRSIPNSVIGTQVTNPAVLSCWTDKQGGIITVLATCWLSSAQHFQFSGLCCEYILGEKSGKVRTNIIYIKISQSERKTISIKCWVVGQSYRHEWILSRSGVTRHVFWVSTFWIWICIDVSPTMLCRRSLRPTLLNRLSRTPVRLIERPGS